ncbi:hypothetical protein CCACVL1_05396 [Corchorus capsularis]|uniref:Uncharacterized protein n=1 Tax=Corchorus capsularis TaxID=210143 RepID=A0A1R3JKY8_COCAP|nr:hypothetical protein CCACVL1_05396 [Corchorus capsularis]
MAGNRYNSRQTEDGSGGHVVAEISTSIKAENRFYFMNE